MLILFRSGIIYLFLVFIQYYDAILLDFDLEAKFSCFIGRRPIGRESILYVPCCQEAM